MKATLLFVTLATWMMGSNGFAMTELEVLRERCARQEQEIRRLEGQVRQQQGAEVRSGATVKSAPVTAAAVSSASPATYVVRKGDSIERIARRHGCSAGSLAKANGLKSSAIIHPGQKLKVPGSSAVARSTPATSKPAATAPAASPRMEAAASAGTHKIASGETYASIARKHRISVDSLIAANPGVKPTALRPGQVIRLGAAAPAKPTPVPTLKPASESRPAQAVVSAIGTSKAAKPQAEAAAEVPPSITSQSIPSQPVTTHAPVPTAAPEPAPAAAPAPAATAATPPAPNNPEKKIRSVTIEGEMSYGEFAAKHGTDTDRLNDLNGLDLTHATVLAKGSELYVPAQP